jgi:hypothetical protein
MEIGRWVGRRPPLAGFLAVTVALGAACAAPDEDPGDASFLGQDTLDVETGEPGDTIAGTNWTFEDWNILEEKVRWAAEEGLAELPMGDALARMGETFVGTTYTPATLEAPGDEHLVINLRELDCVTFIESMLALTWLVRSEGPGILSDRAAAMRRFEEYLTAVRYRDGRLNGYPSRLHYFSEWLSNNDAMGLIDLRTDELGGVPDPEPITFMGEHRDAYRQLEDDAFFEEIRRAEERLNAQGPRTYIPQEAIAGVADGIRNGDLIAATSSLEGLDVAHTGIAFWKDGRLHLMHAPLVGRNVEISELPLAERIQGISGQDGIMVATPQEWPVRAASRP